MGNRGDIPEMRLWKTDARREKFKNMEHFNQVRESKGKAEGNAGKWGKK